MSPGSPVFRGISCILLPCWGSYFIEHLRLCLHIVGHGLLRVYFSFSAQCSRVDSLSLSLVVVFTVCTRAAVKSLCFCSQGRIDN